MSNFSNSHPEDYEERLETMLDASDLQDPLERDIEKANAMLLPWHEDLKEVARFYKWLEQIEEPPESVVDFLLNVESWQEKYEIFLVFSPKGHWG